MSLSDLIGIDDIIISEEIGMSVDKAIDVCCSILLKKSTISAGYVEAIKRSHNELGAYYVLAPGIAMPHARPEDGVNSMGLQLTVFKHGVDLQSKENGDVYLAVTLAAVDSNSHIKTIMSLSELFQNEEDVERIISSDSKAEILEIIQRY